MKNIKVTQPEWRDGYRWLYPASVEEWLGENVIFELWLQMNEIEDEFIEICKNKMI